MTSFNISLPEPLKKFIEAEVRRGGYGTPSEYLRALVRAQQKRKQGSRLERLLLEGLDSGESTPMTRRNWEDIRRKGVATLTARRKRKTK